jgi:hypothetical protein
MGRHRPLRGLDRMVVLGCRQLRSVLAEYADHYNFTHRALGQAPPHPPDDQLSLRRAGGLCDGIGSVL